MGLIEPFPERPAGKWRALYEQAQAAREAAIEEFATLLAPERTGDSPREITIGTIIELEAQYLAQRDRLSRMIEEEHRSGTFTPLVDRAMAQTMRTLMRYHRACQMVGGEVARYTRS